MTHKIILKSAVSFPLNMAVMLLLVITADAFILNAKFYEKALIDSGLNWNLILMNTSPKFKILLYTLSILLLFLKYSLISLLIYSTFYLNGIKTSYHSVFTIVCLAEMIFLIPTLLKVIWFIFSPPTDLIEWTQFYPLSLHSLFSSSSIHAAAVYPLQLLNIFELVYILSLAFLLHNLICKTYDSTLKIVLVSYLPGLFVWTLISTYFTVMLNQS